MTPGDLENEVPQFDRVIALPLGQMCVSLIMLVLIVFLESYLQGDTDAATTDAATT